MYTFAALCHIKFWFFELRIHFLDLQRWKEGQLIPWLNISFVMSDLCQPTELFASHQYFPWLTALTNSRVKIESPFSPVVFALGTGIQSLNHVIRGIGKPDALQVMLAFPPEEINICTGGFTVKTGGIFSVKIKFKKRWKITNNKKGEISEQKFKFDISRKKG